MVAYETSKANRPPPQPPVHDTHHGFRLFGVLFLLGTALIAGDCLNVRKVFDLLEKKQDLQQTAIKEHIRSTGFGSLARTNAAISNGSATNATFSQTGRSEHPRGEFDKMNTGKNSNLLEEWSSWINTSGIVLSNIWGDPAVCTDVIYTGDNRDPTAKENKGTFVTAAWKGLKHIVRKHQNRTTLCLAFFKIPDPFINVQNEKEVEMHPVWGRVPATALVMASFSKATYFLYMDSDALLAFPDQRALPSYMYKVLSYDGYGSKPTYQFKKPGLIVNKPFTGWMCMMCERFGLGHGCFNTGALLWRRSEAAQQVLRAWWESRFFNESQNFFRINEEDGTKEGFPFWEGDEHDRLTQKMSEQTRLYYIYATNPNVHKAVWSVPKQISDEFKSTSCPNALEGKMPCLQFDYAVEARWNTPEGEPWCFLNHYPDEKDSVIKQSSLMFGGKKRGK